MKNKMNHKDTNFTSLYFTIAAMIIIFNQSLFAGPNEDLLKAADEGNLENVKKAINNGANINSSDTEGMTALMYASMKCHLELVKILIDNGADFKLENYGLNALSYATTAIITNKEDPNINEKTKELIKFLLEKCTDCKQPYKRGSTLVFAAYAGYFDLAKLLLAKGADLDEKDSFSELTALMMASIQGHLDIVKLLTERGANINSRHPDGKTALSLAKDKNHKELIDYLISKGAKE